MHIVQKINKFKVTKTFWMYFRSKFLEIFYEYMFMCMTLQCINRVLSPLTVHECHAHSTYRCPSKKTSCWAKSVLSQTKHDLARELPYKFVEWRQTSDQVSSSAMNVYLLLALCGAFVATVSASDLQDQIDKFAEDLFRVKEEIAKLKERIDAARLAEHEIPGRFGIKQFLKYVTAFLYFSHNFL